MLGYSMGTLSWHESTQQEDADCYLMHRMQSTDWPYPKGQQKLLETTVSLCSCPFNYSSSRQVRVGVLGFKAVLH